MAKTFIGELILRMKDETNAKAAANRIDGALKQIEQSAKRLNGLTWGGKFESQLNKLGVGAKDIDRLRVSWDRLYADMSSKNLSKALQKSELNNWKTATLGHFAKQQQALRDEMKRTEAHARTWRNSMNNIFKSGLVAMGAYTGAYMGGVAIRGGLSASSEWEREKFRQQMANIPLRERGQIVGASVRLGGKYPSVGITDIAELGRSARSMMGNNESGLAILPDLVKGMVTLQSTKGTDVATDQMRNLLRGIDNAGKNSGGELGVNNTRDIIAGLIRAAQIEGEDLDVGKMFAFARRGKISVPGLSTDFLATTAPAFMQDMTAEGFGTALSSAYQAFVIGSSAVASKPNLAAQRALGIRNDDGLVNDKLFGTDPYAWVKQNLMPALVKSGVDLSDETAVAKSIAALTRNTNASGLLTRMVTQSPQVDRLRGQYAGSMGPDAADQALTSDPFVSYKGFIESLNNLAAAVGEDVMPTIVSGLNSLSSGINSVGEAWRNGDPVTKAGVVGAGAAGAFGVWKVASAIWGLITAGTNLNAAAVSLQVAAASLGGGAVPGVANNKNPLRGKLGWLGAAGFGGAAAAATAGIVLAGKDRIDSDPDRKARDIERFKGNLEWMKSWFRSDPNRASNSQAVLAGQRDASAPGNPLQAAVDNATRLGGDMKTALSVEATPTVNTASIDAALQKALALVAALRQAAGIKVDVPGAARASADVGRSVNRSFSDIGVGGGGGY